MRDTGELETSLLGALLALMINIWIGTIVGACIGPVTGDLWSHLEVLFLAL